MSGVEIKPSPLWLQSYLSRVGIRPISNIVDLTNYYMMLTAQPLHAYDYDKVKANADKATLVVRKPNEGEKITLLGGKEVTPRKDAIMIASADKLIGIAGVMGGADTEVDENTKNIILECATFDMYSIRRTAMEHGLFTDAVTRFNKGQSPLQNDRVLAKIVKDIEEIAGGKVAGPVIDNQNNLQSPATVSLQASFVNERLGLSLNTHEIAELLTNVEFLVSVEGEGIDVTPPFWRTDIEIAEDVVEEVGRLYGYDKLPLVLPKRSIKPVKRNELLELKSKIRDTLSRAGANEVLTYSFVHGNLLDKTGQNKNEAYQLSNAISPDLQYFRLSLMPSLLDKIHPNIKAGFSEFAIFEIGKSHIKGDSTPDEPDLPYEYPRVALAFAADAKSAQNYQGAAYYQAYHYLTVLLTELGIASELTLSQLQPENYMGTTQTKIPYFEPSRASSLHIGNINIGNVGEYKATVRKQLKLPAFSAGFELDLYSLLKFSKSGTKYQPLPRFPKVEQDISLKVPTEVPYNDLFDLVNTTLAKTAPEQTRFHLSPIDIYQSDEDKAHKNVTLRLSIASYEKTLKAEEVNTLLDQVAMAAKDALGAERI